MTLYAVSALLRIILIYLIYNKLNKMNVSNTREDNFIIATHSICMSLIFIALSI